MGRIICSATMCVILRAFPVASDSSKSIMVVLLVAMVRRWRGRRDGEAAGVAQEQLDQVVADVAVAAEHLERVVGDLEHLVGGVLPGEVGLARGRLALVEAPGGLPGEQPHGVDLDRHVRRA